jgi:hypothetical protein
LAKTKAKKRKEERRKSKEKMAEMDKHFPVLPKDVEISCNQKVRLLDLKS